MTNNHHPRSERKPACSEPDELERIIADYVDQLNAGRKLDPIEILAEHPEHGGEILESLKRYLDVGGQPPDPDFHASTFGDYTLRRQIGCGGMGVVYDAWQNSVERQVALKVLPPGFAADNKAFNRFMRESKTAAQLNHKNVVSVYSSGVEEGTPWFSMEYVKGETLAQLLARLKDAGANAETPFGNPEKEQEFSFRVARAFAGAADGMQHAHAKGITHRDIKPSNLILDPAGTLRILDFGLAHLEGQESLTASGGVVGTLLYMSPEQAKVRKIPIDHRTDIYSLGATLYELLTRTPPFKGKNDQDTVSQIIDRNPVPLRKRNTRIPRELETIVMKCMRKEAANRYRTAEALSQDLRRFVRGDPVEAWPEHKIERLARWLRRHRPALSLAVLFVSLLAVTGWFGYRSSLSRQAEKRAQYLKSFLCIRTKYAPPVCCLHPVHGAWTTKAQQKRP